MRSFMLRIKAPLTAGAVLAALVLTSPVQAQYAPYQAPYNQAYGNQAYGQPQAAPGQNQGYGQVAGPQYGAAGVYQGYTQGAGYVPPYAAPRVAMAYQPPAQTGENLPLTAPTESVAPGVQQNGGYGLQPMPAQDSYATPTPGYPAPAMGGAGCNCQGGGSTGYESYGVGGGCDSTAYGACNPYGGCNSMSYAAGRYGGCGYWFGGVYGLLMDRDDSNQYPLAFTVPASMPDGYPPTTMDVVMTTRDVDVGFQPGVEFRLGRAFGGGCDPCSCCSCGPQWGLEGVYWILFDEDEMTQYVSPVAPSRTYTMMPMYGLEYDPGDATYRPVNTYWDHGTPSVNANPYRVTLVRQRSSFEAQNLEINLLKLGVCGGGCGSVACGPGAGASIGYGCDSCAGCDNSGCCAPRGSRYSCTALCGFRWMQFDEDFMFGVDYDGATDGFLNYNASVENNLIGAQIGCNGMYRIGCKWGLHVSTAVGVYGDDVNVRQYFQSPTGLVRYTGDPTNSFDVNADKTDVSMVGELRLGASYQATCHCRVYGGWRAIGITGIALATDQTPNAFLSAAQMGGYVNSNGSMILHGLQAGVEWNY